MYKDIPADKGKIEARWRQWHGYAWHCPSSGQRLWFWAVDKSLNQWVTKAWPNQIQRQLRNRSKDSENFTSGLSGV